MPQVVIENPILNSPYKEPGRHFKFSDEGITNEIVESRRTSSYFIPIAKPKSKTNGKQLALDSSWTRDRIEENEFINRIRERVAIWRKGNYVGITKTTRQLLEYWTDPERERKLFFCQIEALETAIYLTEVANKFNDNWIENTIREHNNNNNPGLYRIAFKMATGTGKTVVMAMLIAWQVLNKIADLQNAKFTDAFLILTPGITIRDCCDSDALINLNDAGLLNKLRNLVKAGRIKIPEGVIRELNRYTDKLAKIVNQWESKYDLVTKLDERALNLLPDIERKYGPPFKLGEKVYRGFWKSDSGRKSADSQLVALAKSRGWIVVSNDPEKNLWIMTKRSTKS